MINNVSLTGRLTRDPDLRTTQNGKSVATFSLAVDRNYKDDNGKRQADFITCVLWGKAAETFCNFTSKGSLVGVTGRIQTRSYENKKGDKVYVTEVWVNDFSFLGSSKNSNDNQKSNNATNQNQQSKADPFNNTDNSIDISDDDLPF